MFYLEPQESASAEPLQAEHVPVPMDEGDETDLRSAAGSEEHSESESPTLHDEDDNDVEMGR